MDIIRCGSCNTPSMPSRKVCPKCGESLKSRKSVFSRVTSTVDKEVQKQKMDSVISDDNEKTLSKADLNEAIIEAEKRMARKKAGNIAGVFACVFGGLGIFTFGLLFVPLAFITAAIGFISATIGRNGGGQAINVIAYCLLL